MAQYKENSKLARACSRLADVSADSGNKKIKRRVALF